MHVKNEGEGINLARYPFLIPTPAAESWNLVALIVAGIVQLRATH